MESNLTSFDVRFAINHKIYAIKAVREATALGLKASKLLVEALERGEIVRFTTEQLMRLLLAVNVQGPISVGGINDWEEQPEDKRLSMVNLSFSYPEPVRDVNYYENLSTGVS